MFTSPATPILALCEASAAPAFGAAVALALAAEGGAPEWIQLMPAGPALNGRDGRSWTMRDPAALVARTSTPFALDYEHAQDKLAVNGQEAPASGWVEALEIRAGQVWGRVSWTPRAAAAIASREYRFISPAFTYRPDNSEVVEIIGGSLVNRPNFTMAALNSRESSMLKDLLLALGLSETADIAAALNAIHTLKGDVAKALNSANSPSLDKFVPRSDYDVALNRAVTAETALATNAKSARDAKVAATIETALKAGKIAPASKDYHLAACSTDEGLSQFEKFISAAPSLFTEIGGGKPADGAGGKAALNAEQRAVAVSLGISAEDYSKHLAAQAAAEALRA